MKSTEIGAHAVAPGEARHKATYRRPELVVFGAISEFTAGGSGVVNEGRAMTAMNKKV